MSDDLASLLVDPASGRQLHIAGENLECDGGTVARKIGDVWSFLEDENSFYEGAYLNRIHYVPSKDTRLRRFPFWFVASGYVWEICRHFAPGARLLELGCASGVDYLAQRYKMIGLDYSLASLQGLCGYELRVQANAEDLPFAAESLEGAISSYFWEHIRPGAKDRILQSLHRCIRPGGRILFLYDIESSNRLIRRARSVDPTLYQACFLDRDGHVGYETVEQNESHFESNGFRVKRQIGMERTLLQSASTYKRLAEFPGSLGRAGRLATRLTGRRAGLLLNIFLVRLSDVSIGKLRPLANSRILMTVAERI